MTKCSVCGSFRRVANPRQKSKRAAAARPDHRGGDRPHIQGWPPGGEKRDQNITRAGTPERAPRPR